MNTEALEYAGVVALLVILAIPLSAYIHNVMTGRATLMTRVLGPVERGVYKLTGVNPEAQMDWKRYLVCALAFSAVSLVGLWAILMGQGVLPFNPEGIAGMSVDLAFNTAVSFVTNTNWQAYSGESALSYFSQAAGLTVQNFVTPAVGMAVLYALFRGIKNVQANGLGNFWADVTRCCLYVMLPICLVATLVCVSQGSPQNLGEYQEVALLEPVEVLDEDGEETGQQATESVLPLGPQASQVAPKQAGTNGGGYNGVNSASPLENPTPLTNLLQLILILLIPVALVFSFGRFVESKRQGWAVFAAAFAIFIAALGVVAYAEMQATPQLAQNGAVLMDPTGQSGGNMEGKESRFGVTGSSLWAVFTTAASNGSVNSMHDSFTPMGGFVTLLLMQLGEIIFGGVGCGLYSLLGFVLLTVFIASLMVGRTPEYLGKKLGPVEMRMAVILCVTTPLVILVGCTALCLDPATAESLNNSGAHGFSEVLYAATSAGGNNGSAFAGFGANTPFINVVLALEMLANRFIPIVATCVLAGSLASRSTVAQSAGTLSTCSGLFVFLLVLVILLVGALSCLPALALGPIAEQLHMMAL